MPLFLCWLMMAALGQAEPAALHQATGVKVGEVTTDSARIWVRRTALPERKHDGVVRRGRPASRPVAPAEVDQLEGACPGTAGRVRVRYGTSEDLADARVTDWVTVDEQTDFAHVFELTGLTPATPWHFASETHRAGEASPDRPLHGSFTTAPLPQAPARVSFVVVTGQMYKDVDSPDGYLIYEAMARLKPDFIILTGDTVYYDNEDPVATTVPLARYHWQRMYSYPLLVQFHLRVPGYWEKDDHDTYYNDCWPTMQAEAMRPFTYQDGQRVFREQVPASDSPYRTVRWGKGLEVWLTEGRDFRSPNNDPDGPAKSIWGAQQKQWLKESLLASDARWKVLVSPTPIVGPDRSNKSDNHTNPGFAHEGNEFRRWAADHLPDSFFVACGDRHWQYHSVDPATRVQEFSCGPASDQHAGGSPGLDPAYHRFHRVKGGFLSVTVEPRGSDSTLTFRFHDVRGQVVYQWSPPSLATRPG